MRFQFAGPLRWLTLFKNRNNRMPENEASAAEPKAMKSRRASEQQQYKADPHQSQPSPMRVKTIMKNRNQRGGRHLCTRRINR